MKRILLIMLCFLFFSCASTHFPIPGENKIRITNIYLEYQSLGDGYFDLGKYDNAIKYYNYALSYPEIKWTVLYKLSRSYALNKQWKEALKLYDILLERDPNNLSLKLSIAYIKAMDGDLSGSEAMYKTLWEENPENQSVLINYIDILMAEKKYEEADTLVKILKDKFHETTNVPQFEKVLEEYYQTESKELPESPVDIDDEPSLEPMEEEIPPIEIKKIKKQKKIKK